MNRAGLPRHAATLGTFAGPLGDPSGKRGITTTHWRELTWHHLKDLLQPRALWRLGTYRGAPVTLHSFSLAANVLLTALTVPSFLVYMPALALSELAHEWGHAVVAARLSGVDPNHINVNGLGAFYQAKQSLTAQSPKHRLAIALAGPGVNLALGAAALLAGAGLGSHFVATLGALNLFLGAINLLPIVPLDGGHAFEAVLARFKLSRETIFRATTATSLGVLGLLLIANPLGLDATGQVLTLGVLGAFFAADRLVRLQHHGGTRHTSTRQPAHAPVN